VWGNTTGKFPVVFFAWQQLEQADMGQIWLHTDFLEVRAKTNKNFLKVFTMK
jgi:hypothetical protein